MIANNITCAFEQLWNAHHAFDLVAENQCILDPELAAEFVEVRDDFGQKLQTQNVDEIDSYMGEVYPKFFGTADAAAARAAARAAPQ